VGVNGSSNRGSVVGVESRSRLSVGSVIVCEELEGGGENLALHSEIPYNL